MQHTFYSLLNIENVALLAYLGKTYSIIARDTWQSQSKNGLDLDKQHVNNTDDHCVSTGKCICSIASQFQHEINIIRGTTHAQHDIVNVYIRRSIA